MANIQSFVQVCKHEFGREVIYSNVAEITAENVFEVLEEAKSVHKQNREEIDYLYKYVAGDQPALHRTKDVRPEIKNDVVVNHALEIVSFMTAQNYGEPIQYVARRDDGTKTALIETLNKIMEALDKSYYDIEIGMWQSICGTAYREVWSKKPEEVEDDEPMLGIYAPDPRDNFIVYSTEKGNPPLMSVSYCTDEEGKEYYLCTTPKTVLSVYEEDNIQSQGNGYEMILLTEYPNNPMRLSDVEVVITMLDAINKIQSNRADGIEQFVQGILAFINCDIDEKVADLIAKGFLSLKTANPSMPADVKMVSSELNQEQTQVAIDDLYKKILMVLGIPCREQNTGGDTGQAVYLRNGWDFAEQRAKIGEPVTKKSERAFLRKALKILKTKGQIGEALSVMDIVIQIVRNKTDNMLVKAQVLEMLLNSHINPKTAIETVGLFSDPERVFLDSKEHLEAEFSPESVRIKHGATGAGEE